MKKFSIKERIKSFGYAFAGMRTLFLEEHNAYLHVLGMVVAIGMGLFLGLSRLEWVAIVICIGSVFAMELLNSSIEALADHVNPEYHNQIKKVKDLAAAAVLVVAMMSVVVGLLVFLPKLLNGISGIK